MKNFIFKISSLIIVVLGIVGGINYYSDPANLFHSGVMGLYADNLIAGNIVKFAGDIDERLLQKRIIRDFDAKQYSTYILGSSHIMYIPWQYDKYYCAGVSGAMLEDDIAIWGLIEERNVPIERIIICVDPWLFLEDTGETRYKSIENEYKEELKKINGTYERNYFDFVPAKYKELFSPAYLQSSVRAIMHNKGKMSLSVSDNQSPEEVNKTLPNGRRIMSTKTYSISVADNTEATLKSIASDTVYHMKKNSSLSPQRITIFENFIDYLLKKGIELQFYLPAWNPVFYDEFKSNPSYQYFLEMEDFVVNFAKTRNINVHGTYSPYVLGITMEDYADSLHLKPEIAFRLYSTIVR